MKTARYLTFWHDSSGQTSESMAEEGTESPDDVGGYAERGPGRHDWAGLYFRRNWEAEEKSKL